MSFFKKLFGLKENESQQAPTNSSEKNNGEIPHLKKKMTQADLLWQCVDVYACDMAKDGYEIGEVVEDLTKTPQLTVTKNGSSGLVFVYTSKEYLSPREKFEKESLKECITFAHNKKADCIIVIVSANNLTTSTTDLFYGDEISYRYKSDMFPCLGF